MRKSAAATRRGGGWRAHRRREHGERDRRLLDHLDTALLSAGKLELQRRGKPLIVVCAAPHMCSAAIRCATSPCAPRRGCAPARRDRARRRSRIRGASESPRKAPRSPACGSPAGTARRHRGSSASATSAPIDFERDQRRVILRIRGGLGSRRRAGSRDARHRRSTCAARLPIEILFHRGRPLLAAPPAAAVWSRRAGSASARPADPRRRLRVDGDELDLG